MMDADGSDSTAFDGIRTLVLPVADLGPLQELYIDLLGFHPTGQVDSPDPAWQQLWGLPVAPTRVVSLERPGGTGGGITLVKAPGLPGPEPAGLPDRAGPYALDLYLRGADVVEERLSRAGWGFRSEPVHYALPGTVVPVRERMLEQPWSGLLHALVEYREKGTRCALDDDRHGDVSEVVAAVFLTDRLEEALSFASDVLGGQVYFRGVFEGDAVEELLGLPAGAGLDAGLLRGPASRNARLEFARPTPAAEGLRAPDPVPRVIAGWEVDDLDALVPRLAGHGTTTGVVTVDGRRHVGLASVYGARFDLVERDRT